MAAPTSPVPTAPRHNGADRARGHDVPAVPPAEARGNLQLLDALAVSRPARYVLALARLALGWIFLWAFLDKTFGLGHETASKAAWIHGGSPTNGFLGFATQGPFADVYHDMAGNGGALLLGVGLRVAAAAGALLMLMMWAAVLPPDNNPFMDDHIVYALVMVALAMLRAGDTLGLGRRWADTALVRRHPWLA
jgi:thiosulfate dehydrogenase (quinone) large subunit